MSIGSWLVAQGYAELEMRRPETDPSDGFRDTFADLYGIGPDRRRRQR